jgi:hypothetical protein
MWQPQLELKDFLAHCQQGQRKIVSNCVDSYIPSSSSLVNLKAGDVRFEPYGVSIPFIDFKNKY